MNGLQVFNYGTNDVRTVQQNDTIWFVLKDVCDALSLTDTNKVAERLDADDLTRTKLVSGGQERDMYVINESGLYTILLRSNKPEAKPFRKWVTSEVLPSIRKYGAYVTEATLENMISNPDFAIKLFTSLKNEQDMRKALEIENAKQKHLLLEAKPKLEYVDHVLQCKDAVNITQIAQDYGMSAIAMNKLLNKLGIQRYMNGQWILYAKYAKRGYTKSETICAKDHNGEYFSIIHTKWTQKGRLFIYEILKKHGILPQMEQEG